MHEAKLYQPGTMFGISKPVTGACFWCPPMRGDRLDLRQIGL
ncbi:MAG: hypothetical protein ABIU58_07795 [Ramlibacter sp.]